ncbi:MAG: cob(I)yrinic acid a,c-diamide adenosyltransferase [Thiohalorhabdus sp.]|uniref:cob(I)yrinic acid a,c-diamide adenosyltransferase n=1 Tax=Thiohalorhabdus sp. TaxID=3094134 RepID=UPI0039809E61
MGHRLSRIYTRTGDQGSSDLGDGTRVPKDHPRLHAYGDVDELNSQVGLIAAQDIPEELGELLTDIQHDLFDLGAELVVPGHEALREAQVEALEERIDAFNAELGPLQEFILPGGGPAGAQAHAARAVCRRAERTVYALSREETVSAVTLRYLNRLSDLLFVLARLLNRRGGAPETLWDRARQERD